MQRLRVAKAMLVQLVIWGSLCAGLKCGVKTDHHTELTDLFEDLSHDAGTKQLQCNPKRSYWAPKEKKLPFAQSVDASGNISIKPRREQRQEEFPAGRAGTWIVHALRTSVSCCLHVWDTAKGKRIGSYMTCLLCLCNIK